MANKIVGGAYKNKALVQMFGKVCFANGFKNNIYLNNATVKSYKVIQDGKQGGAGRVAGGAILAGPIGALIGATTGKKKKILIELEWKDGQKSMIECDSNMLKAIATECCE